MGQGTDCDLVDNNCHQGSQPAAKGEGEFEREDKAPSLPHSLHLYSECPPAHVTAITLNGALCKAEMILASGGVMGRIVG